MIRGVAVFAAIILVLQGLALLFMTPGGLEVIYPYALAVRSDGIKTGDAGIGEYFSLHKDVEDAGIIIIAADLNVDDTYRLASDYLTFLGRFTKISTAALYTSYHRVRNISNASVAGDYTAFAKACNNQRVSKALSDQFFTFLEKIYSLNSKLTPDNKITVAGVKGNTDYKGMINSLTTDIFTSSGSLDSSFSKILSAKSPEEFVGAFKEAESELAEVLGDKFDGYLEMLDPVLNGTIEELYALKNIIKYAPAGDGAVFALLPRELCGDDSPLIKGLEEHYGKVVVTNTVYYNCTTLDNKDEIPLNDGSNFPTFIEGIRIASSEKLKGFREYFEKVSNSFDSESLESRLDAIGETGEKTFFIISGSGPVTFIEEKKEEAGAPGTVLVAPGQ
ncbi:MAG: hypothetical protein IJ386_03690 [Clostridia bacterium]|nr:hypothetical protein [Clostridia bacterium]